MVYAGKVTATGTDMKQYKAQFDNISVLKTKVVCSKGYIVDKDGCGKKFRTILKGCY